MFRFGTIAPAAALLLVTCLTTPINARAQDACASLRQYISQLDRNVQSGTRSGVPREQVNHDIELRNRQVQIYQQRCGSTGGGAVSSGGRHGGGLGAAIQMLGLLAPLIDSAARASEAERQRQTDAERQRLIEELDRQRAALAEIDRLEAQARVAGTESVQQQAQAQQDADRAWRESRSNPFSSTTPPSHEIRTFPGTKVEAKLVDGRPPGAPESVRCPSDTTGAVPGAGSLSTDCVKRAPRAANPFGSGGAGPVPESQREVGVQTTQAPIQRYGSAANSPGVAGQDEASSRTAGGKVSSGAVGRNIRSGGVNATRTSELDQQKRPRPVKGMCPSPPSGGRINFEVLTDRGTLLCEYDVRGSFCYSFGRDKVQYYSGGISTEKDRDPPVRCTLEFPA